MKNSNECLHKFSMQKNASYLPSRLAPYLILIIGDIWNCTDRETWTEEVATTKHVWIYAIYLNLAHMCDFMWAPMCTVNVTHTHTFINAVF